ncbi:hypothetical protein ACVWZZ_007323 [Bradyrhizobium sp. LM6.10]
MTSPTNDIEELERLLQSASAENAQLRSELAIAHDRQRASAGILRTIAASPSDARPVFEAIASSSRHLLGGFSATVLQFIGDELHLVAFTPTSPEADEGLKASFPRRIADFPTFALVRGGETIQFPDSEAADVPELNRNLARLRGFRSVLFMPLMNRGAPVGMISVTRAEPGAFAADLVQLLQTFADQAVIAIENARLFNETRETLERQTASADILKVMAASPSDVQPVFDAIAANANRLIGGFSTAVLRYIDGAAHLAAFTPTDPAGDRVLQSSFPVPFAQFPPYQLVAPWCGGAIARHRARTGGPRHRARPRLPQHAVRTLDERRRGHWNHHRHAASDGRFRRASCAAAADLRRPGGDRDQECQPVQRHEGSAGTADRDRRHPQGDRGLARGRDAGVPGDLRQRQDADRRTFLHGHPRHRRPAASGGLYH